jgi:hypothetical protein
VLNFALLLLLESEKPISALLGRAVKLEIRELNLKAIASQLGRQQCHAATTTTSEHKLTMHGNKLSDAHGKVKCDATP